MRNSFVGVRPLHLEQVQASPSWRVAVLAPHPDDFDSIGVTLRWWHRNGNPIQLAVLSACSGVEDTFCEPPTPERKTAIRQQEQRDSCGFFGLSGSDILFPALQLDAEGQPADTAANTAWIAGWLRDGGADLVFLPHGNDTNAGHRQTWAMFRRAAAKWTRPLVGFYNHDPKTIALRVDLLMAFDAAAAEWKGELLRFHRSQQHRNLLRRGSGLDNRIREDNRRLAEQAGATDGFAEAFELEFFGEA